MTDIQSWGIGFIKFLQSFHPGLDGIMTLLGNTVKPEYCVVFILPLLFWNFRNEVFYRLFILMMFDMALGEILRALWAQPRPWWIADLLPLDPVTSVYSCPAGYSSFATIFYGYIAIKLKRKWFTAIGILMILLTGIAKMYDAAMMPLHMLAGIAQGTILLLIFIKYEEQLFNWLKSQKPNRIWLLSLSCVTAFFLLDVAALYIQSTYELPAQWAKYKMIPAERLADGGIVYACGFLFGALTSLSSLATQLAFPSVGKRILQNIVGLAVIIGIFLVLRNAILEGLDSLLLTGAINISLAATTGFWIFSICPYLFGKKGISTIVSLTK